MGQYDKGVEQTIEHWAGAQWLNSETIVNKAIDNSNRYGTEKKMILNAIEDFLDIVEEDLEESITKSKLIALIKEVIKESSYDNWKFSGPGGPDDDDGSDEAFYSWVSDNVDKDWDFSDIDCDISMWHVAVEYLTSNKIQSILKQDDVKKLWDENFAESYPKIEYPFNKSNLMDIDVKKKDYSTPISDFIYDLLDSKESGSNHYKEYEEMLADAISKKPESFEYSDSIFDNWREDMDREKGSYLADREQDRQERWERDNQWP